MGIATTLLKASSRKLSQISQSNASDCLRVQVLISNLMSRLEKIDSDSESDEDVSTHWYLRARKRSKEYGGTVSVNFSVVSEKEIRREQETKGNISLEIKSTFSTIDGDELDDELDEVEEIVEEEEDELLEIPMKREETDEENGPVSDQSESDSDSEEESSGPTHSTTKSAAEEMNEFNCCPSSDDSDIDIGVEETPFDINENSFADGNKTDIETEKNMQPKKEINQEESNYWINPGSADPMISFEVADGNQSKEVPNESCFSQEISSECNTSVDSSKRKADDCIDIFSKRGRCSSPQERILTLSPLTFTTRFY